MAAVRCSMDTAIKRDFPMVSSELTVSQSSLEAFREMERNRKKMEAELKAQIKTNLSLCECPIQACDCGKTEKEPSHPDSYSEMLQAIMNNNCNFCTMLLQPCSYHLVKRSENSGLPYGSSRKPMIPWDVGLDEVTTSLQVPSSSQELTPVRQQVKKKLPKKSSATSTKSYKSPSKRPSHPEEKKYQCDYCNNIFGYKHVLMNHVRTHTGEKPFRCLEPGCGKRFTRDHHLRTHMRLHTGEKPYVCKYCDKKFVQVANLRRHLRVHSLKCDIGSCQETFLCSDELNAHKLTHNTSKPTATLEEKIDPPPRLHPHSIARKESPTHVTSSSNISYFQFLSFPPRLACYEELPSQEEPEDLSLKTGRRSP